jgi:hypothetical protein
MAMTPAQTTTSAPFSQGPGGTPNLFVGSVKVTAANWDASEAVSQLINVAHGLPTGTVIKELLGYRCDGTWVTNEGGAIPQLNAAGTHLVFRGGTTGVLGDPATPGADVVFTFLCQLS